MTTYSVALINPNSSQATSNMMGALAKKYLPATCRLQVMTAINVPEMLVSAQDVMMAEEEVERLSMALSSSVDAIIIGAFGDPALHRLRQLMSVPVIGIGEASLRAASLQERPFAVATVTPELKASILHYIDVLNLTRLCRGVFITDDDPQHLMADSERQEQQLYSACQSAIHQGAEAIVIGGGPLAAVAERLKHRLALPIISPLVAGIHAAVDQIIALRGHH